MGIGPEMGWDGDGDGISMGMGYGDVYGDEAWGWDRL